MISIALPTFNNSDIIWIQLESLCRQKVSVDWELIVCEEPSEKNSKEVVKKYASKLIKNKCVSIKYLTLDKWIPLARKWNLIDSFRDKNSVGMLLCASDNFSFETRVQDSFEAISNEGLKRVIRTDLPKSGVDSWLFKQVNPTNLVELEFTNGIHTDGFNTISHKRRLMYKDGLGLFTKSNESEVFAMFPKEIQGKLLKMRL